MTEQPDDETLMKEFDALLAGSSLHSPAAKYIQELGREQMQQFLGRIRDPQYRARLLLDTDDPAIVDPEISTIQLFMEKCDLVDLITLQITPEETEQALQAILARANGVHFDPCEACRQDRHADCTGYVRESDRVARCFCELGGEHPAHDKPKG